ncbi:MAG: DUF294 nucleotidyltransferase-like domain-containing protein [Bacteroidota bacterium]
MDTRPARNGAFPLRIILPTVLTLGLFVVSLFAVVIPRFEEIIVGRKREMIRELTVAAWHLADRYYRESAAGRMTEQEAQRWTIEQLRHLRYGEERKDYFWITDYEPRMIVHPYREDLNGKSLTDFRDSRGKALFVEIVRVVRSQGEGYVDYTWQWKDDSTRIVPKLSYVRAFAPWGWIIGTGIYLEDVKLEIGRLERNVRNIAIGITVVISLLLLFILSQNLRSERKRRRAENDLRESKERYKALAEATTEGLLMVLEGGETYYNKTLLDMSGYAEEEAGRIRPGELFPGTVGDAVRSDAGPEQWRRLLQSHLETGLRRRDGSRVDVLLRSSPISFHGKTGCVVTVRDISHHKQIAGALDESIEKYRTLTNQLSLAVFRTEMGKEMRFIEANPAAPAIFGCRDPEELRSLHLGPLFEDPHEWQAAVQDLLHAGFVKDRILRLRRRKDLSPVVTVSLVLVNDEHGHPRYCDGIAEDITGKRQPEEDTRALMAELDAPLGFLQQPVAPFIREPVTCAMDDPLRSAMSMMRRIPAPALLVRNASGAFVGMLTNRDLQERVLAETPAADRPVQEYMRAPLVSFPRSATIFDALLLHTEQGAWHLAARDDAGAVCGILSVEEMQKSHLLSHGLFLRKLGAAETCEEIRQVHARLRLLLRLSIESGAGARSIARLATVISDAAVRRIVTLTVEALGPPPGPFVFLALGSEGRSEQTLATDQDNAILYEDVPSERADAARAYFRSLGERICNTLDSIGYAFCKGNVMAKNPKWCQPLAVWKGSFTEWVTTANPQDLLDVSIFFDFRGVHGEASLADRLRQHLFRILSGNNAFFVYLAQNALRVKPPIGQLKSAEHFDVKLAMLPLTDLTRLYALRHGIAGTNTPERLDRLRDQGVLSATGHQDLLQAYTFLLFLRYRHQAALLASNAAPNNLIPSHALSELDRTTLRRVLTLIEDYQSKLSLDFKGTIERSL